MPRPAIVSICRDETTARNVDGQLRRRYGADYEIRRVADSASLLRIDGARLLLVDALLEGAADLLAEMKERQPATRRLAIAPWGQPISSEKLHLLMTAGLAEYFVTAPQSSRDEQFHRTISEFLEESSRGTSDVFQIVRMVDDGSPRGHHLRDLLQRNNVAYGCFHSTSPDGAALLAGSGTDATHLPVFTLFDGRVLEDPTTRELADAISGHGEDSPSEFDVIVVGAGPAGLSAAVYAASEGLTVGVLEREAIGGQAGTTASIRNYLGFQRGITGQELASRAFRQAWSFGADVHFITEATALSRTSNGFELDLSDGSQRLARCVLLAQGVAYRRLSVPHLESLVGAGVYYGAAVTEAPTMRGKNVVVVGGGNSAGQAALHLSKFAEHVTVVVRSRSLAESMSEYLIRELRTARTVSIEYGSRVVDGRGSARLEGLTIEDVATGSRRDVAAQGLFVLIGAVPSTDWLPSEVAKDAWGYVRTGREAEGSDLWSLDRAPYAFESTMAGVFAVGDVREGSVKRVASAVGEGSAAIQSIHSFLSLDGQAVPSVGAERV